MMIFLAGTLFCRNQDKIPETMVNLEVWVRTGFNLEALVNRGSLINAGPLGPSGRSVPITL